MLRQWQPDRDRSPPPAGCPKIDMDEAGVFARQWARTALRWGGVALAIMLLLRAFRRADERAGQMVEDSTLEPRLFPEATEATPYPAGQAGFTSTRFTFSFASAVCGSRTFSTPFLKVASAFPASTPGGSGIER